MKAKPDTWMPLVIGDYLKDTARLTTEQHGAYLLLIFAYWTEGPPPDDDEALAAITRLGVRAWKRQRPKLARYFRIEDGAWRHGRIDRELQEATHRKSRNTERAQKGAAKRWAKSALDGASGNASSIASGTSQGLLEQCPPPEVGEGYKKPSPPSRRGRRRERSESAPPPVAGTQRCWRGPAEVRAALVAAQGEGWTHSWLDPCGWDGDHRSIIAPYDKTIEKLTEVRELLALANVSSVRLGKLAA